MSASPPLDSLGRRRSPATVPGYLAGRPPRSKGRHFPADPPRPVAPHLIMRKFNVPDFSATHIRFVVKTSQCTGAAAFHGNQDADPANDADCDTNVAANSTRSLVRSAELQVFRSSADIDD